MSRVPWRHNQAGGKLGDAGVCLARGSHEATRPPLSRAHPVTDRWRQAPAPALRIFGGKPRGSSRRMGWPGARHAHIVSC